MCGVWVRAKYAVISDGQPLAQRKSEIVQPSHKQGGIIGDNQRKTAS